MKAIRLMAAFFRASVQNESAFRTEFVMNLVSAALTLAGSVGGLYIVFANNEALHGWHMAETLAVLGTYMLVQALKALMIGPSLNKMGGMDGEIETGTFDYALTKPVSKQLYVSIRQWNVWQVLHIAVAAGVLAVACNQIGATIGAVQILFFFAALFISQGLLYAIVLMLSSLAFWYRGTYVMWILEDILQTGRYPIGIYPPAVRMFLTWVVPVGFIVSVPADALIGGVRPAVLAVGLGLLVLLLVVATLFFRASLRRYASASS